MSTSASSILDFGNESTKGIRRWGSKTHTPSSKASTPLMDRTNTTRTRSSYTASTANSTPYASGMTTFLPEMHSTPPMPTFPKPDRATSTPLRRDRDRSDDNTTPSRSRIGRRPMIYKPESSFERYSPSPARTRVSFATTALVDRIGETPNLPRGWSQQLDRAICILDASDYTLAAIVSKVRRVFPELTGTLTPAMIDKRLRQLDQIPELNYWAVGLAKNEKQQQRRGKVAKTSELESKRLEGSATMTEASPSEKFKPVSSGRAKHTPIRIEPREDERTTTPVMVQGRNLVTRNFLTGFRSQFVRGNDG